MIEPGHPALAMVRQCALVGIKSEYGELGLAARRRGLGASLGAGRRSSRPQRRTTADPSATSLKVADGRRLRVLNIVDDAPNRCAAPVLGTLISGRRNLREFATLVARHGTQDLVVSDTIGAKHEGSERRA